MIRALSEANMATEAGLIVLDVLSVYTDKFKVGTLTLIDMFFLSQWLLS